MDRTTRRRFLVSTTAASALLAGCSGGGSDGDGGDGSDGGNNGTDTQGPTNGQTNTNRDLSEDLERDIQTFGNRWSTYGGNTTNQNTTSTETLEPTTELWSVSGIVGDALGVTYSSSGGSRKTVFAPVEGPDGPTLAAYELASGERKWYLSGGIGDVTQMTSMAGGFTPWVTDGTVVANLSPSSGNTITETTLPEEGALTQPLRVAGDYAYGGTGDAVYSFSPAAGVNWTSDLTPAHERGPLAVGVAGEDPVLVAVGDGQIAGLNWESGETDWTYETVPPRRDENDEQEPVDVAITPTTERNSQTAIAVDAGDPGTVHAVSTADGSRKWRVEFDEPIPVRAAVARQTAFVATESSVYAVDTESGELLKRYPVTSPPVRTPPLVTPENVVVGDADGIRFYAVTSGSQSLEISVTPRQYSNVALTGSDPAGRQLFVVDDSDTLHVYGNVRER
jgi:hypothetical protein